MTVHPPLPHPLPPNFGTHSCGTWWTGHRKSHCAAPGCCTTFSSETAADMHRKTVDGRRVCVDPASVGLVPVVKPWGTCWSMPGSPPKRAETAAQLNADHAADRQPVSLGTKFSVGQGNWII